ncbi:serine hydrolase domain-containing protein [Nocardioides coralli]|uniref:serine hydrolase domain-containing protein n=1 Tax=Nocardioides coralli TaxID=2872154 RepID=UPI001CA3FE1F|nr:serine hydrolase domain-containing protein [Nocardioides coralli]QZY27712.1 beta-lactamase family protein [Nocardioides coralli]
MTERRQDCLDLAQANGRLTSVVGAVFDRYGVVWAGASGDCPGIDGQYRIGSITKTLTAVLVMQERDAGRLDLDDPLGRHLGDVGYADARIRDLLSHTSGMQSEPAGPWWERSRGVDIAALLAANDGSGRVAAPGEYYHYSNLGYGLLGEVVARLAGQPWRQVVAERLLGPLGMTRTSYLPRPGAQPGWSVDHFTGIRALEPLTSTGAMAPAGQLWSTVADLVTWGQFLSGARPDVLAPASLTEMSRPVEESYGLGLRLSANAGGVLIGHGGSMPGFMAALYVDPGSGIGGVVLSNATTGIDPERLVMDLIDGDFVDDLPAPWRPTSSLPAEVAGLPGLWFWGNSALELRWHNEGLDLRSLAVPDRAGERFELHDGRLRGVSGYHRGETLHVHRRADGTVRHLECATFVYTRTPYDAEAPIPGGAPRRPGPG